jgi:F420-dependent oxidoreductase-like protein
MRIGLMIGPERGQYATRVDTLVRDAVEAEALGFDTVWVPQIPSDLDALSAIALIGRETHRVELGTAVMPIQTRHPVAMAQQALLNQAVCRGRFTLGLGPSHHWIVEDMLGLSYEHPARQVRDYVEVLNAAFRGPGPVDVENTTFRVHNVFDITDAPRTPILLAALAPMMLRIAGEHCAGTILWMADERAIGEHVAPRIAKAAAAAGRDAPRVVAGVPVVLCAGDEVAGAREKANAVLGHSEYSPNYQRLLEHGNASEVGDLLAAGDEAAVIARLQQFRDAGATDLAVRVLPLGADRAARIESRRRTQEFVASLGSEL